MKKFAIVTMMFLLALSASSFATQTRTEVMGFNDGIMVDDYNVFRFPGRTFNYPNLVVGEFSIFEYDYRMAQGAAVADPEDGSYQHFYDFGVNWQFGDENPWVLGTYISTLEPMEPEGYNGSDLWNQNLGWSQNRRINLIYGRQLGGHNFGFGFEYIRGGRERDNARAWVPDQDSVVTDVSKETFGYYKFSFGLTEGTSGKWDVALNVAFGTWTDEDMYGFTQTEPDGYLDLSAEGRYFWVKSPKVTLVPHAGFAIGKRGANNYGFWTNPDTALYESDNWNEKHTLFAFEGGMGMHYTSGPDLLAVMDVGFRYSKVKDEGDYITKPDGVDYATSDVFQNTTLTLPYLKIGFEGSVFKWMDIRFGATTYWNIDKDEDDYLSGSTWIYSNQYTYKEVWNETYLGFGFHWGRLHVDVMTDPEVFLRGFNFISGDSPRYDPDYYYYDENYGYMNTKMSVLYEMF
ncbi:MAG: hypothetical protein GY867_10545 [bacterium]|nr:hypothetical protein [bacterium]